MLGLVAHGLLIVVPAPLRSTGSRHVGSVVVARGLQSTGSVVVARGLQTRRFSSCGTRAQLLCGMWDLPGPGIKPMSPALAGGLPTTAPPGSPCSYDFKCRAEKPAVL